MPNPFLNIWGCNQWAPDVEQQSAVSNEAYGPSWEESEWDIDNDEYNSSEPGTTYSAEEWYNELIKDWPELTSPVINTDNFIAAGNQDAKNYWVLNWQKKKPDGTPDEKDTMQCFDYAAYQLLAAKNLDLSGGYKTSDYGSDGYFQVFTLASSVNINDTAEAVIYLKEAIKSNIPALAGIYFKAYDDIDPTAKLGNKDKTTNHFVVIVSMNKDENGYYFTYFDYLSRYDPSNKLYLNIDLSIKDPYSLRQVAQVRKSR